MTRKDFQSTCPAHQRGGFYQYMHCTHMRELSERKKRQTDKVTDQKTCSLIDGQRDRIRKMDTLTDTSTRDESYMDNTEKKTGRIMDREVQAN